MTDETWDHKECRTDLSDGCPRCCPKSRGLCCDIHSKEEFDSFFNQLLMASVSANLAADNRGLNRSIVRSYMPNDDEVKLLAALFEWRDKRAQECVASAILIDFGEDFFIPSTTIQRIVDCAHGNKVRTLDDLRREVKTPDVITDEDGREILDIIHSFLPPPAASPFVSTPLVTRALTQASPSISTPSRPPLLARAGMNTNLQNATPSPAIGKVSRTLKCSRCGQTGHNSEYLLFIQFVLYLWYLGRNPSCPTQVNNRIRSLLDAPVPGVPNTWDNIDNE